MSGPCTKDAPCSTPCMGLTPGCPYVTRDAHEPAATIHQLTAALVDPTRKTDWFSAGADSFGPDHSASHYAMENIANAVSAMMNESGFPLETFMRILRNQVVEIDRVAKDRLRAEASIGNLGRWELDS